MIRAARSSGFSETIVHVRVFNDDTLLVVDASTKIMYLDHSTLRPKDEIDIGVKRSRHFPKLIGFSPDAKYFALISEDFKESKLYETRSKSILAGVDRHQGEVSCVAIDPKGKYMFSCGDDGISYAVEISTRALAFTLPPHKDFVNDIAFSHEGNIAATAGYDRNVSLYNIAMMMPMGLLRTHSAPVMKLAFLDNYRLLSIDKKGAALITDVKSKKTLGRLNGIHDDINDIVVGAQGRFIFLGTKLGYVMVYDAHSYEQISSKYVKFESTVSALGFRESSNELIAATDSGELLCYAVFDKEELLKEYFKEKRYDHMYDLIKKNHILKYTDIVKNFEKLWEKTLHRAKMLLENREKIRAQELFKDFSTIPSKKQTMQKLISEYEEYEKFLGFIKAQKLSLAYALANLHPLYKETKAYNSMEAQWEKDFALARKYLLNPKLAHKVDEILAPYRGISEKTLLVQNLTLNVQVYKRFRDALNQRSFKVVFELLKLNPFLKEYPEYKALMNYSDGLYMKAQTLLGDGDTHAALKIFRTLLDFDDFKDEAKEVISEIEARQKFFNALKEDNISLAYALMDDFYSLRLSEEGKELLRLWEEGLQKASECAALQDLKCIEESLRAYMKIESKKSDIANVFALYHLGELRGALEGKMEQKTLEKGIKNYILYYGPTKQIEDFFESFKIAFPDTKLNPSAQKSGSLSSWRPSMIVKSILD